MFWTIVFGILMRSNFCSKLFFQSSTNLAQIMYEVCNGCSSLKGAIFRPFHLSLKLWPVFRHPSLYKFYMNDIAKCLRVLCSQTKKYNNKLYVTKRLHIIWVTNIEQKLDTIYIRYHIFFWDLDLYKAQKILKQM